MPGDFITKFLNAQFVSFSQRAISQEELCTFKSFDTAKWNPDYSNPLHREFYYLKYSSAYITEYYLAYQRIFEQKFLLETSPITVISAGCGAMLDLVGLEYARTQSPNYKTARSHYYGVDILDWECDATQIGAIVNFFGNGLGAFSLSECAYRADIISFPKSIYDIPPQDLIDFANSIEINDIMENFCVINSKRGNSCDDTKRATLFCNTIAERLGYSVRCEVLNLSNEEAYFEELLDTKFDFNVSIAHYIQNLCTGCEFSDCEEYDKCCGIIQKYPMRYARNIKPEIYYLEKKSNAMA